jgi:tetratricopeptide (TPR) repeat protein
MYRSARYIVGGGHIMKRFVLTTALLLFAFAACGASEFFTKGEALFVQNKPKDARPLLESALNDDPGNEMTYLYLGIIYQQLGDVQKAIDILDRGLSIASAYKELFYYNMGNDHFSRKDYALAEEMYSRAVSSKKDFPPAYLNRANARMQLQKQDDALADYTLFLQLAPTDTQRPNIEKVMAMIRQAQVEKENARLAEEAAIKQEAARQAALLEEIQKSLENAGDATKNLSVDSVNGQTETVDVDIKD